MPNITANPTAAISTAVATRTKTVTALKLGVATLGLALSLNFAAALLPAEGFSATESSSATEPTNYSGSVSTTDYVATDSATTADPSTIESTYTQPGATVSSTDTTSTDFTDNNTVSDTQYSTSESYVAPATDYSFSDWVGAIGERIYDYATYNFDASIDLLTNDSQIKDAQTTGTVEERTKTLTTLDGEIQRINILISKTSPLGAYDDIVQLETARKEYQHHYDTITAVDNDKLYGALHDYSHAIHDLSYNVGGIAVKVGLPEKFTLFDQKLTQLKKSDSLNQYSQLESFYTSVKEQNIKLQALSPKERYDTGLGIISSFVANNKYYFDLLSPVMENGLVGQSQSLIDARQTAFDIGVGVDAYYNDKVTTVLPLTNELSEVLLPFTCIDKDGDGFLPKTQEFQGNCVPEGIPTDCNDNDNSINPNAKEVCNGVDDNCNGVIDTDTAGRCYKTTGVHKVLTIVIEDWIWEMDPNANLDKIKERLNQAQLETAKAMKEMSYGKMEMTFDVCWVNKGTKVKLPLDFMEQETSAVKLCNQKVAFEYNSLVIYPSTRPFPGAGGTVINDHNGHQINICTVTIPEGKKSAQGVMLEVNVFGHELGHCLSLPHAGRYDCSYNTYGPLCYWEAYGNSFDFMGNTFLTKYYDDQEQPVFPHYSCFYKEKLNWLQSTNMGDRPGTYKIGVWEESSQLPQCLVFDVDQKYIFNFDNNVPTRCDKLYLEYRKKRNFGSGKTINGGVAIHCFEKSKIGEQLYISGRILDCTPNKEVIFPNNNINYNKLFVFSLEPDICHTNLGYDISFKATDDFSGKVTVVKANPSYNCVDQDDDGYQIPNVPQGCTMIEQKVDCNDKDWKISPNTIEKCMDKIDNNCNGQIDEGC